jgi:hypothetical protein
MTGIGFVAREPECPRHVQRPIVVDVDLGALRSGVAGVGVPGQALPEGDEYVLALR